jgi:small subunit ribosomal protein S8e
VRTNTLVKSAIVQIDATPFRQWYEQHYGINLGKAKTGAAAPAKTEVRLPSHSELNNRTSRFLNDVYLQAKKEAAPKKGKKDAKKEAAPKKEGEAAAAPAEPAAPAVVTDNTRRKLAERRKERIPLAQSLVDQFAAGRLYASITSRPGQCGRCDGYILEGEELNFYLRKLQKKKGKAQQ